MSLVNDEPSEELAAMKRGQHVHCLLTGGQPLRGEVEEAREARVRAPESGVHLCRNRFKREGNILILLTWACLLWSSPDSCSAGMPRLVSLLTWSWMRLTSGETTTVTPPLQQITSQY